MGRRSAGLVVFIALVMLFAGRLTFEESSASANKNRPRTRKDARGGRRPAVDRRIEERG